MKLADCAIPFILFSIFLFAIFAYFIILVPLPTETHNFNGLSQNLENKNSFTDANGLENFRLDTSPPLGSSEDIFRFILTVTGTDIEQPILQIAEQEYLLYNDGLHDDILANDNSYGTEIRYLPVGTYTVNIQYAQKGLKKQKRFYPDIHVVEKSNETCTPLINNQGRINIVIVAPNFPDVPSTANKLIDVNGIYGGFFSIEPFKSNQQQFNFWYVNTENFKISQDIKERIPKNLERAEEYFLATACNVENKYVVILLTEKSLDTEGRGMPAYAYSVYQEDTVEKLLYSNRLMLHEFAGHAFARLEDEYFSSISGIGESTHSAQCYFSPYVKCEKGPTKQLESKDNKNNNRTVTTFSCKETPESKTDCLENAFWKDQIGDGCGLKDVIDCPFRKNDLNTLIEVGCYLGCGKKQNLYRSTQKSIMANQRVTPYFGPVNERLICRKIYQVTEKKEGICTAYSLD